jgi:aryl-alcohol dehydrogenase-like predicted oxidoreductase
VLGRALAGRRDEVVIATKFGYTFDTGQQAITGQDASPGYIGRACRASLRRLGTDRIDLYQLHLGELPAAQAQEVAGTLEDLVADGLIRGYGWSTDDPQRAAAFAGGAHCVAIQYEMNVLADAPAMVAACDRIDLASIIRGPLAMGLLTGKYGPASQLPPDDVRAAQPWVGYFTDGRPAPAWLARLDAIREVLSSGGRTLAQGALCWPVAGSPPWPNACSCSPSMTRACKNGSPCCRPSMSTSGRRSAGIAASCQPCRTPDRSAGSAGVTGPGAVSSRHAAVPRDDDAGDLRRPAALTIAQPSRSQTPGLCRGRLTSEGLPPREHTRDS